MTTRSMRVCRSRAACSIRVRRSSVRVEAMYEHMFGEVGVSTGRSGAKRLVIPVWSRQPKCLGAGLCEAGGRVAVLAGGCRVARWRPSCGSSTLRVRCGSPVVSISCRGLRPTGRAGACCWATRCPSGRWGRGRRSLWCRPGEHVDVGHLPDEFERVAPAALAEGPVPGVLLGYPLPCFPGLLVGLAPFSEHGPSAPVVVETGRFGDCDRTV